jgi:predicted nuclease of restriction endonuclease-like (RecB) superfamily
LERNIQSSYFQRILSTNPKSTPEIKNEVSIIKVTDFIKDPYIFEFLNLPLPLAETENNIESALIQHLQQFLLELGKGFSFVSRQFRISTETSHFFIDLVFYNYLLKCFVIFDLKTTKLSHQDVGQLDMYVRMFDDLKKQADDNPTIGILLCTEKDETVVKYSVLSDKQQLFATKYMPYLPTEQELKQLIEQDRINFELDNNE